MKTKTVAPSAQHLEFLHAIHAAIGTQGKNIDVADLLAILSHCVGQLIALQDQRKMTPEQAMQIVVRNIERGNADVVDGLMWQTGGNA